MDYNSCRGYDDSCLGQRQEQQQLSCEYRLETVDDCGNGGHAVDNGRNQMKNSIELRNASASSSSSGKLFVGGVSWETSEETFADYFSKFGEVVDSVIMTDKISGKPRGFGFVTFADSAVAERVLEEDHIIDGRKVDLKRTVPREEMELKGVSKTKKIFVGGLSPFLDDDELKEYFCFYGDIIDHQIMYDRNTGRSRGFGFVTFQTEEAVDRIFSEGKIHELGGKQVEIKRAEPKRAGRDSSSHLQGAVGRHGYEDGYSAKGNVDYNIYSSYGGYGAYGGNYMAGPANMYGYGGYVYGYGFGGSMFNVGYGPGGYSHMGGYGNSLGYGGGKVYGNGLINGDCYSSSAKGNGTNGSAATRYHPYQK